MGAGRRRYCLPPVSPYRCRRQAALDLLFDDVWRELVGWMEELVRRHWEGCVSGRTTGQCLIGNAGSYIETCHLLLNQQIHHCQMMPSPQHNLLLEPVLTVFCILFLTDDEKNAVNFNQSQSDAQNPFLLLSTLPTLLPRLGQSRVPQLTGTPQPQVSDLRGGRRPTNGSTSPQSGTSYC